MEETSNGPARPRKRVDAVTALMVALTVLSLGGAVWLRFGPGPARRGGAGGGAARDGAAVAVGSPAPRVGLLDPATSEPMVLTGLKGRVVWLVFWSSRAASGKACLAELAPAARALRGRSGFALVTAAVEPDGAAALGAARAALGDEAGAKAPVPVYLAAPETPALFRAENADPPLHVLIDAEGTVVVIARHAGRATIERIAEQARRELEATVPPEDVRFAAR